MKALAMALGLSFATLALACDSVGGSGIKYNIAYGLTFACTSTLLTSISALRLWRHFREWKFALAMCAITAINPGWFKEGFNSADCGGVQKGFSALLLCGCIFTFAAQLVSAWRFQKWWDALPPLHDPKLIDPSIAAVMEGSDAPSSPTA